MYKTHSCSLKCGLRLLYQSLIRYSWRHQILSLAALGYRTIAPDLRGYGDTDAPPSPESYTVFHIVGDLVGLLDSMGIDKVFLVGHDWGAAIAWYFCLFRPDRVKALVNMSIVFQPRNPNLKPVDGMRALFGDDYYICRFQVSGALSVTQNDNEKVPTASTILVSQIPV